MSTTFLKKIEKNFKNAAKTYFMRVSGQKNYVKYASGWKNHKKMIKYDTMIQQKIISEKTKHQPCFYKIHT